FGVKEAVLDWFECFVGDVYCYYYEDEYDDCIIGIIG
ncbi:MAG: hypothetical protein EZS28_038704, partial [Streblomastix strix]